jgi:hypothetical protein
MKYEEHREEKEAKDKSKTEKVFTLSVRSKVSFLTIMC